MTHQEVIALVEKWLDDKSSVTADELKRAYAAAYAADVDASYAYLAACDAYGSANYAAAAAKHVKQYHQKLEEQAQ
jgi:hypothetical protein